MAEYILKRSASIQETETERGTLSDLLEKKNEDIIENQLDQELNEDIEIIISAYSAVQSETHIILNPRRKHNSK